ncbi:MAG: hypothetical protein RL272_1006, partial [Candidatus Parcubacteria bacterium]
LLTVGSGDKFQVDGSGNITTSGTSVTLAGNSTVIDMTGTGTLGLNTTTNRAITTGTGLFRVGGDIGVSDLASVVDQNGNKVLVFDANASAVNQLTVANASTGGSPVISATGTDTNIGIDITSKGTYALTLNQGVNAAVFIAGGGGETKIAGGYGSSGCTVDSTGNLTCNGGITTDGNTTLGTNSSNTVTFNAEVASSIIPSADNTYDLGSSSLRWKTLNVGPGSVVVHNDNTNTNKVTLQFNGANAQLVTDSATPLQLLTGGAQAVTVDAGGSAAVNVGTTNASGVTLGHGAVTTAILGKISQSHTPSSGSADEKAAALSVISNRSAGNSYGLDVTSSETNTSNNANVFGINLNAHQGGTGGNTVRGIDVLTQTSGSANTVTAYGLKVSDAGAANSAGDHYGIRLDVSTGSAGTHYGVYSNVSGGANAYSGVFMGGSVGIGDATPAALLTVGNGDKFQVDSSGNLTTPSSVTWTLNGAANALNFDANTLSIDALNNRVGIGTASPAAPLQVYSSGGTWNWDTNGDLKVGDATYGLSVGVATGGGGAGDVRVWPSTSGTRRVMFGDNTDGVAATFSHGGLSVASIPNAFYDILDVNGGMRTGLSPTTLTTVSDNPLSNAATTVNVASTTGYPARGTLLIDSEAMQYAGVTATSFTGVVRGALGTTAASHTLGTSVNVYLSIQSATASTPRMVITGSGNVGIATAAPTDMLSVGSTSQFKVNSSGETRSPAFLATADGSGSQVSIGWSSDTNTGFVRNGSDDFSVYTGGTSRVEFGFNGNTAFDTNTLFVDAVNNRVGVGTTAPGATFAVSDGTSDKFRVAGTDGDVTFTDDQGTITFPATGASPAPMIQMFASGTSNTARMVIAHSSSFTNWGLQYDDTPDKFNFLSGGTGVMTVDLGNQRVGVGTTSPSDVLEVVGTGTAISATDSSVVTRLFSSASTGKGYVGTNTSNDFVLRTGGTDRVTIDTSGRVGIGMAPSYMLDITDNSNYSQLRIQTSYSGGDSLSVSDTGASSGSYAANIYSANGIGVYASGGSYDFYAAGAGTDYGTSSSIRWKKNIVNITDALSKVLAMRGVYYDWDEAHGGKHDMGMIAEEVGQQVPEVVGWDPDAPGFATGMDYGHLTPIIIEGLKGLNAIVIKDDGTGTYRIDKSATATALAPAADSKSLSFRGSAWDAGASAAVDRGLTLTNVVTDKDSYKLSLKDDTGTEVSYLGSNGDVALAGKLYPSDRGVLQTNKYIYYDGSSGLGGDFMRTNASGWGTGSYDFAEMFPSDDALEAGELVMIDTAHPTRMIRAVKDDAHPAFLLAGAVSTRPGFLAGMNDAGTYPVALSGRVPMRVVGPVVIGDPVTYSPTPGVGTVATDPTYVVGIALEAKEGTGPGTVT